jgi:mono/diheme cytochrome c family protein
MEHGGGADPQPGTSDTELLVSRCRRLFSPGLVLMTTIWALAISGCGGDVYSESMVYPVRQDPLVTAVPATERLEPDRPGQLPIYSMKDLDDPRGLFYLDVKDNTLKFIDPSKLSAEDRDELEEALEFSFGTPANPKVDLISDETRKILQLQRDTLQEGSRLYRLYCLQCHGLTGDGRGPTAKWVNPHPRDYRPGIFKFQSVDQATDGNVRPPRREDLVRTIYEGVEGTAMQSYNMLPEFELNALVSYVIHLSIRGEVEGQVLKKFNLGEDGKLKMSGTTKITTYMRGKRDSGGKVREVAEKWRESQEPDKKIQPGPYPVPDNDMAALNKSIQNGYDIFVGRGPVTGACTQCHTDFGHRSLFKFDEWATMVRPRDLTKNVYRGGRRPIDIYYRIHSGINGSGMLRQGKDLTSDQIWDVVNFVLALPFPKMREHLVPKID